MKQRLEPGDLRGSQHGQSIRVVWPHLLLSPGVRLCWVGGEGESRAPGKEGGSVLLASGPGMEKVKV